jgi:hypothetical protein
LAEAYGFTNGKYNSDGWSFFEVMKSELNRFARYPCTYYRREELEQASFILERMHPKFESLSRDFGGVVYPVHQDDEMLMQDLIRDIYDVLQGKYLLECSVNLWWSYEAYVRDQEAERKARSRAAIAAKARATRAQNLLKKAEKTTV